MSFHFDDDGLWHLFARLSPDEGASFEAALLAARDDLFHARFGDDSQDHNPNEICWADALAHVADLAASPEATGHPVRERHRVHLHLRAGTLNDLFADRATGGGRGDGPAAWMLNLHMGPALPDSLRRYLLCDCDLIPVLEKFGIPVSVGRTQRSIPDRTRTLIEERDRGCRAPGCTAQRWLQVHHLWHWENGGPTDTHNLCCLCAWHHRAHHAGKLGITGNADRPDGLVFTDQQGRVIRPYKPPKPPGDPPGKAAQKHGLDPDPYQHPLGEELDTWAVYFQPA